MFYTVRIFDAYKEEIFGTLDLNFAYSHFDVRCFLNKNNSN